MKLDNQVISIAVPIKNEEIIIEKFLLSMKEQDLPNDIHLEILLIDGMSSDTTKEKINNFIIQNKSMDIKLFMNKDMYTPHAMNIGILESTGKYLCIFGCHTIYPKDYIKNCYNELIKMGADCAGGWAYFEVIDNSFGAKIVASIRTHKFGIGNSFRTNLEDRWADTVSYSIYDKEIFKKVGLFNTKLIRAQDYEMNKRITKNGGKIWFSHKIVSHYFDKQNFYELLKKQLLYDAPYNIYMFHAAPYTMNIRHSITLLFSLGVIIGLFIIDIPILSTIYFGVLSLYATLATISGIQKGLEYKNFFLMLVLPICFFLFHFIHGLGMIYGLVNIITNRGYR